MSRPKPVTPIRCPRDRTINDLFELIAAQGKEIAALREKADATLTAVRELAMVVARDAIQEVRGGGAE